MTGLVGQPRLKTLVLSFQCAWCQNDGGHEANKPAVRGTLEAAATIDPQLVGTADTTKHERDFELASMMQRPGRMGGWMGGTGCRAKPAKAGVSQTGQHRANAVYRLRESECKESQ
ncbi:hypothetical protein K431DRAFT_160733 [Polychaeton citri CBS 116435]|uniref:Uncharacterized protein n=1 Tax=Polychaeton citri CBS 116435 TaxID=1314669 RepID=A0A9P4PYB8_9PEZI|nr:hypothetical protein K431DRAFT_160733 [Polychaeton citri CBS 116435]